MTDGMYETNDMGFVYAMQRCIADVCDSTAWLTTAMARNFVDANGRVTYDDTRAEAYQKFFFDINRMYRYCAEILPDDLKKEVRAYIEKEKLVSAPNAISVDSAVRLVEKMQEHVQRMGLKNTLVDIDTFDFECYLQ
ncbi:MAG: hypothetical protein FWE54_01675 [Methanimicrococcus sp.]|nr:hypothetical protein [Methanimicrococcus sp.]